MSDKLTKIQEYLRSEEGQRSMEEYVRKLKNSQDMENSQLERFHSKFGEKKAFAKIVEKIRGKYDSNKYRDHWWNKGCEPPKVYIGYYTDMLKSTAENARKGEWNKYGGMFTSTMHFVNGYCFARIDGQGSFLTSSHP